jgi:hypothetical protein
MAIFSTGIVFVRLVVVEGIGGAIIVPFFVIKTYTLVV